ncbi:MAG: DEAD/DEAH box helicase, partial [Desulfoprunum sp.]|nr:DEAD/DEAH box helicase [Desulfoprunum sp.]
MSPAPPSPQLKPDIEEYLTALKASKKFGPQVICHKVFPEVERSKSPDQPPFSTDIQQVLQAKGIEQLYSHQVEAISHLMRGDNILVATPTASGKSMIYNLPVLQQLLSEDPGHALYLFPLKALAQDQLRILIDMAEMLPAGTLQHFPGLAAIYDGDTSVYQRRKIKDSVPAILMTNPDMLHLSILPFHGNWSSFLQKLRYIVIDEVHTYRGVFGSHMAWVLRRLQRIIKYYGGHPRFVLLSATIGNPKEFGEKLIDRKVHVITQSGAARAEKHFVFLNPWDSAATTASQLLEAAMKRGLRTIVYTKSRRMTELIHLWTCPRLGNLAHKLSSYRAGFLPEERRKIEGKLNRGELLGVVSTSALELGIDIGDLDLCILVGYPGSIMASWQRGGRVGRQFQQSAIIMIGQEDALDQHFMRQPEDFFCRSSEAAVVNPLNETIVKQHLHCAAAEIPLAADEPLVQNPHIKKGIDSLTRSSQLLQDADGKTWYASLKRPQRHINLRGGGVQLALIDCENGVIFGEMDGGRALTECHPGAVYIHRANSWIVEDLDIEGREVKCRQKKPNYYTRPISTKETEILEVLNKKTVFCCPISFGRIKVTERVTGYQKFNIATHKLITTVSLDLPEQTIETEGFWLEIPREIQQKLEESQQHFMGAIHALEHAMISLFPLLVLCDRNDIGGISCPWHAQTEGAAIFVYDGHAGGVGLSAEAYHKIDDLLMEAEKTIQLCRCENGCPSCVHSPKCGSGNRPIDKVACLALLKEILRSKPKAINTVRLSRIQPENDRRTEPIPISKAGSAPICQETHRLGRKMLPGHYGVFDLETIRSAAEVGGWHRCERMGISVAVLYDSQLEGCVTYLEHEVDHLIEHLQRLELVVGFNNRRFDYRVLGGYSSWDFNRLPSLDLLEEVSNHLGYRLSLDRLAQQTLGIGKSADGLQALQWYKEGR